MSENLDELAGRYAVEERMCEVLAGKVETARTGLGRRVAQFRLGMHQVELGQITDEYDVAELYGLMSKTPSDTEA
ncbi:MAG: hypothetical protein JWO35_553 [Candidatus Saccharibacteria bacterium]|nr:hypothetical protein [Candidatus Saccharibacteria bacterium]